MILMPYIFARPEIVFFAKKLDQSDNDIEKILELVENVQRELAMQNKCWHLHNHKMVKKCKSHWHPF